MTPIIDLHCDLLAYLRNGSNRSAQDLDVPCAIPFLRRGGVQLQTMAIYTHTNPFSENQGMIQYEIFKKLPQHYPDAFKMAPDSLPYTLDPSLIGLRLAIENASSICNETAPLSQAFENLQKMISEGCRPIYMSLTWNGENRFGGGTGATIGLKEEGKRLLDWMSAHGVAIDFSHASDLLAHDILNYIDQNRLKLRLLASHSNVRTICDMPRNLPDELAKEILTRKGIIGVNFVRYFIGKSPDNFIQHFEKILSWGGENQICMGADFFYDGDVPPEQRKKPEEIFFPDYQTAACYPKLLALVESALGLEKKIIDKIAYKNLLAFLHSSSLQ